MRRICSWLKQALGVLAVYAFCTFGDTAHGAIWDIFGNLFGRDRPLLRVDGAHVWPSFRIPVCWTASASAFVTERQWVEQSVKAILEANSPFTFVGWDTTCDDSKLPQVIISVADARPMTGVGYRPVGSDGPTSMLLNFTFSAWAPSCGSSVIRSDSLTIREHCIRTIAVHEFLHALGALHEQLDPNLERDDLDCFKVYNEKIACPLGRDVCGEKPMALTSYDRDSIMNYCRNGAKGNYYDLPTALSPADVVGLNKLADLTRQKINLFPDR